MVRTEQHLSPTAPILEDLALSQSCSGFLPISRRCWIASPATSSAPLDIVFVINRFYRTVPVYGYNDEIWSPVFAELE